MSAFWQIINQGDRLVKSLDQKKPYTVAVDFDDTIAQYNGWQGEDHFEPPKDGAKKGLQVLRDMGFRIIVFTTRGNTRAIAQYMKKYGLVYDHVNRNPDQPERASGKVIADVYLDDRGLHFVDWATAVEQIKKRSRKSGR